MRNFIKLIGRFCKNLFGENVIGIPPQYEMADIYGGGNSVNFHDYSTNPHVTAVVNKIADCVSAHRVQVFDKRHDSMVMNVFANPNDDQSMQDFLREMSANIIYYGEAFVLWSCHDGKSFSMHNLHPKNVEVLTDNLGNKVFYEYSKDNSRYRIPNTRCCKCSMHHVLHVKENSDGGIRGKSRLSSTNGLLNMIEQFDAAILRNLQPNGKIRGALTVPMSCDLGHDERMSNLSYALNAGAEQDSRIIVMQGGEELKWQGFESKEQMPDRWIKEDLINHFYAVCGVPSAIMTQNNGANRVENTRYALEMFKEHTLRPITTRIEKGLSRWLDPILDGCEIRLICD